MITYHVGDATDPIGPPEEKKLILHVCNDYGGWGRGFVVALSRRWRRPEQRYKEAKTLKLGSIQFCMVHPNILVVNMIAQHGNSTPTQPAIRYDALQKCLEAVHTFNIPIMASIHMPRIGCGLGGGSWDRVEEIINTVFRPHDRINVYDLPRKANG